MAEHAEQGNADVSGVADDDVESAKAKFRAALDAKQARHHDAPGGGHSGGGPAGHAHGAVKGQKMFRRKSGG